MRIFLKFSPLFVAVVSCLLIFNSLAIAKINASSMGNFRFPITSGLKVRVEFWKKVYTRYSTSQAVVHDQDHLDVIYEVANLSPKLSHRQRDRSIDRIKRKYKTILRSLARKAKKKNPRFNSEEKRLQKIVKGSYIKAARNIRIQLGQSDRFREGLKRSGKYLTQIRNIFQKYGLPSELTVLPHVESSFQLDAYSSAGAAGIWQFTRGTGRRFMRIGYEVDERLDPILATDAAARLLKFNYQHLESWPLAITAYNHGLQGMKKGKRRYGDNIEDIIRHYRSRTFGFASQNFYCEFLAALDVVRYQNEYFPNLKLDKPVNIKTITFRDYIGIKTVMESFNMSRNDVRQYNPALRSPVIDGSKRIPRGFVFQVPTEKAKNIRSIYASISKNKKHKSQKASKWYRIRRGDTLSDVAMRFRTTVTKLKRLNHIGRKNLIFPGQVLQLPDRGRKMQKLRTIRSGRDFAMFSESGSLVYRVRRYDNLSKIAKNYRIDPVLLAAYNGMNNPDSIVPGQILKIPVRKNRSSKNIDVLEKKDHLLIKSRQIAKKKTSLVQAPLELAKTGRAIKNRPAFLPVVFESHEDKSTGIGIILVDFDETMSHYADWAKLSLKRLRRINNLRRNHRIHLNQKIKVPFYRVTPTEFEEKREEYHKAIQEDFFNNYEVMKTITRKIKRGETIWDICNKIYSMPFWLLSMYNPGQEINSLNVGESILIPIVTRKNL